MQWGRLGLAFFGLLVAYFAVPLGSDVPAWRLLVGITLTFAAVLLAGWIIIRQVRYEVSGVGRLVRIQGLLLLLEIVIVAFATAYYMLAESTSGQMAGLDTRLDSLYFTIVTMATVGYGDIHAAGQFARGLVTAQIVFNLIFVGALTSLLTSRMRDASASHVKQSADAADEDG
jgi:voltage-gated potassium channel